MNHAHSLGVNIRRIRKQANVTINDLAAALGVSIGTVSRWERGDSAPSRTRVAKIAEYFGTPLQDIETTGEPQSHIHTSKQHDPRFIRAKSIAFQGRPGAYSHEAAVTCFPHLHPVPCDSFAKTFQAVQEGYADLAAIPIENSLGGRVADIHLLLPESNLFILGEYFLPVSHALMIKKGVGWNDLQLVKSHPQALAQCRKTLQSLGVATEKSFDTAGAAEMLAADKSARYGVLASELAAEIYGLEILRPKMEDRLG
ncbi:MAG: prephenate dehydratase domain-containing protein, partial [Pseudomonadota bacterium]